MGCTKNYALNYRSWYKCVGSGAGRGERERAETLEKWKGKGTRPQGGVNATQSTEFTGH
jgi:hypothetical protein